MTDPRKNPPNDEPDEGRREPTLEPTPNPAAAAAAARAYSQAPTPDEFPPASPPGGEAVEPPPAEPAREQATQAEVNQLKDQLLRALAETENTRRRAERDREETSKYAVANFARDVLTVADNLRRAIDSVPAEARTGNTALATLIEGVELTERQLQSMLEKYGITIVAPMDQPFDPNFHQAMFEVPGTGKTNGTVVQVLQPGFVIHGRLLRPALVGVAKG